MYVYIECVHVFNVNHRLEFVLVFFFLPTWLNNNYVNKGLDYVMDFKTIMRTSDYICQKFLITTRLSWTRFKNEGNIVRISEILRRSWNGTVEILLFWCFNLRRLLLMFQKYFKCRKWEWIGGKVSMLENSIKNIENFLNRKFNKNTHVKDSIELF